MAFFEYIDGDSKAMEKNIQVINGTKVTRYNGFLSIKMELKEAKHFNSPPFIGYGLEGYVVACMISCWHETNVAFIRETVKEYGTCNQIDGYIHASDDYTIVVSSEKVEVAKSVMSRCNLKFSKILIFNTLKENIVVSNLDIWKKVINKKNKHYDIKKYLQILNSSSGFQLSSGKKTNIYIETLPAANMYEVIERTVEKYSQILVKYDVYVGLGFGGVYFAIVSAMLMGKKFFVLDMKEHKTKINYNGDTLFFDDFISTGTNIEIADSLVDNKGKKAAIVLYAKKNEGTCIKSYVCDII